MEEIALRPATKADLPLLHALDHLCFPPEIAYHPAEFRGLLAHPSAATRIAHRQERIVGFAIVRTTRRKLAGAERFEPALHLMTIDVAPEARRRGVGARLMRWVLAHQQSLGLAAAVLEVAVNNEPAKEFYHRFGFTVTGRIPGYYGNQLDAFTMERQASSATEPH